MRKILFTLAGVLYALPGLFATTCPGATAIPAAPTLPYTQSLTCGTSNDFNASTAVACGSDFYYGGLEAMYAWTPTGSYNSVTIDYSGQTWSGIFLYEGCPMSGGTCIANTTGSGSSQSLTVPGTLNGGATYYLVFDTWPSPASPCPGSFTINGTLLSDCSVTTPPGNTLSSTSLACSGQPFTLSLQNTVTNESGITYQWQSSTDNITYTDIAGATGPTYTATQTSGTYYQCIVQCSFGGTPETSTPVFVDMNAFLNCYCSSSATYTGDEDIFKVKLGTLNNSSTCSTTGGTGSSMNLYSDYTALAAPDLAQTATYNFEVQVGTCGTYFYDNVTKIFIDFNQNGLYTDPGETVFTETASVNGPHTITGSIVIPATALLGNTGMRVVTVETTSPSSVTPCGTYYYGETEDYYVNILPIPSCPQPTAFQLISGTTDGGDFSWTAGGSETQWQIQYGPVDFAPGTGTSQITSQNNPFTLSGLAADSFFDIYVRGICGPGDTSIWTGPISFNTYGQGLYMDWNSDCPTTGFIDISGTGNATALTDDGEFGLALPFPLLYQGSLVSDITIGNNGGVLLGTQTGNVGYDMTSGTGLYPYVQDLNTPNDDVYYETIGTAPNRKFVIMWSNIAHYTYPPATDGATFELIIDEATQEIYYVYDDVMMGNTSWDYGQDAEIGVRGPNQNLNVSMNSNQYLQDNSCVHFYYTDCPRPTNFVLNTLFPDEASFSWTPGLSGETNWTIEYGEQGFTPGSGSGTIITSTSPDATIVGLTQNTYYDVYIYADCANGDQSIYLMGSFLTLPFCSNPVGLSTSSSVDSIFAAWNWTEFSPSYPSTGFNLQYGFMGFEPNGGTIVSVDNNTTDTIADMNLMGGGVYDLYVQAVCGTDTSAFVGPVSVTMPLTNDTVCAAENLNVNGTVHVFNNGGATVSTGESTIAPDPTGPQTTDGWINSNMNFTTWFTFQAPASGNMRLSGADIGFDGQFAVYEVGSCGSFNTFTLVAANDNEIGGTSLAPNFTICGLTPGATYYLVHDSYSTSTTGIYSIKLSEIDLNAGTANPVTDVCSGDTVSLFNTINNYGMGGMFSDLQNTQQLMNDSLFATTVLAYSTFDFQYTIVDGCAMDSVISQVKIYGPSSAGEDGTLTVCKNQPLNLLEGLNGNADLNGTWYDPSNMPMASGNIVTGTIAASFSYDYIAGNGVCPDDTSFVTVVVQNCDYLSVDELAMESVTVYPNPANNDLFINAGELEGTYKVVVRDMNGRDVIVPADQLSKDKVMTISVRDLEPGMYFINISNETNLKVFKVIVE